jgi:hypothetical protein
VGTKFVDTPANAHFIPQSIENACCTVALLHALANVKAIDSVLPLEEYKDVHERFGAAGETVVDNDTEFHYICIVPVDGHAVWLDGRLKHPIDLGDCSQGFGEFVANHINSWLNLESSCFFAAFALVQVV